MSPPPVPPPARLLRMTRGFSCLFWSMPLLAMANAAAFAGLLPARWLTPAWLGGCLPLACGLLLLRAAAAADSRERRAVERMLGLALLAAGLAPFRAWWGHAPERIYFAANAGLHYGVMIGLLAVVKI